MSPARVDEATRLNRLRRLLSALPPTLPTSQHDFRTFSIPCEGAHGWDDVQDYGRDGYVNRLLEVQLCPGGRQHGLTLQGRGPGLVAVVDVLASAIAEHPENAIFPKWVSDLTDAAIRAGADAVAADNDANEPREVEPSKKIVLGPPKKKRKKGAKGAYETDREGRMHPDWEDAPTPLARGPGGAPVDPLLDEISIFSHLKSDTTTTFYRCAGADAGCTQMWKPPRQRARVLKHASACAKLLPEQRQRVNEALAEKAPSVLAAAATAATAVVEGGKTVVVTSKAVLRSAQPVPGSSKQPATEASTSTSSGFKPSDNPKSVYQLSKKAHIDHIQKLLDLAIVKFMCASGMPPHCISLPEWPEMWKIAFPDYRPAARTTLVDSIIPKEAAAVRLRQIEFLRTQKNLTISFDAGTIRSQASNLNCHITTEDGQVFFFEGRDGSADSHTGEYYFRFLDEIITEIGPLCFRGICSDNTGNTTVGRDRIHEKYPWILVLPDTCHRLSLLCKDLMKLQRFASTLKVLRRGLKYLKKSTAAKEKLTIRRRELKIGRGLVSIGKTRFATIYHSAISMINCMPAIHSLCNEGAITIKDVNDRFKKSFVHDEFMSSLKQITNLLAPVANSITCLESATTTLSDVYLFWLACTASIHELIESARGVFSVAELEFIRRSVNFRYQQMITDAPNDVYFTAFVLDPRFRDANIIRDLNPLAIKPIKIGGRSDSSPSNEEADRPESVRRAGRCLLRLLQAEYENRGTPVNDLDAMDAIERVKDQIYKFVRGSWPFDRPFDKGDDPLKWWIRLDEDRSGHAQPLAHLARILYAVTPNSMADERTQSIFTWLNSPSRNRQHVATLTRMAQIRDWYKKQRKSSPPSLGRHPVVKFRDLSTTIYRKRKRQDDSDEESNDGAESESSSSEDEDDMDSDDDDSELDSDPADAAARNKTEEAKLDVNKTIDISSSILLDYLSSTPVVVVEAALPSRGSKSALTAKPRTVPTASDWTM